MELISILIIFCGLFVGWGIGANDAANCFGTSVGAGLVNYKKAVWIVALLVLAGAMLQGQGTMNTIGKGIVDSAMLSDMSIVAILLSAALITLVLTIIGLPISTTQAVIGSITGVSLLLHAGTNWPNVMKIFVLGFGTAVIALILGYVIFKAYSHLIANKNFVFVEKLLKWIVIGSGAFLAYGLGANNIGNAMGLIASKGLITGFTAGIVGGLAISVGSLTLGKRVMRTVGSEITQLNAPMAFSAQLGAAIAIYILTLFSIPTSTTFGIVGAVTGVGLVKGMSGVEGKTVKKITFGWILTPVLGAIVAPIILLLLRVIL